MSCLLVFHKCFPWIVSNNISSKTLQKDLYVLNKIIVCNLTWCIWYYYGVARSRKIKSDRDYQKNKERVRLDSSGDETSSTSLVRAARRPISFH